MTTEKQIAANRLNALKAGVKTEAGKAVSRLNAVTHGIFSREAILPGEDEELLTRLRQSFMDEFQPVGELETILVEQMVSDIWRLKRVIRSEKKYSRGPSAHQTNPDEFIAGGDYRYSSWQNFIRYDAAIKRSFYQAVRELKKAQQSRSGDSSADLLSALLEENGRQNDFEKTNPI
jgi:hypothetical protein